MVPALLIVAIALVSTTLALPPGASSNKPPASFATLPLDLQRDILQQSGNAKASALVSKQFNKIATAAGRHSGSDLFAVLDTSLRTAADAKDVGKIRAAADAFLAAVSTHVPLALLKKPGTTVYRATHKGWTDVRVVALPAEGALKGDASVVAQRLITLFNGVNATPEQLKLLRSVRLPLPIAQSLAREHEASLTGVLKDWIATHEHARLVRYERYKFPEDVDAAMFKTYDPTFLNHDFEPMGLYWVFTLISFVTGGNNDFAKQMQLLTMVANHPDFNKSFDAYNAKEKSTESPLHKFSASNARLDGIMAFIKNAPNVKMHSDDFHSLLYPSKEPWATKQLGIVKQLCDLAASEPHRAAFTKAKLEERVQRARKPTEARQALAKCFDIAK